jgi:nuclear pore complex protein Nup155
MYDIPDRIFEQYNRAEVSTMMGLFADLNHAWVTIDNALYLWDYTNPNPDVIGFEEQSNSITAVKMVKPRAGVFVKDITHLLVVATTAEMILLGVAASTTATGVRAVALYQTKMSLSIRGINVQVIEGSAATGRIFFAGKADNEIYELTYQQEEKWFANRCGRVNHTSPGYTSLVPAIWAGKSQEHVVMMVMDDSRRLLYTLSSESSIRTFHMDTSSTLTQAIEKKRQEFLRDISHMISQSPLLTNTMKICSISPISSREGSKLHLMATTTTGCRLFLSATRGYAYGTSSGAPQSMQVQHIKFPPRIDARPASQSQAQSYGASEPATDTSSIALSFTQMGLRFPPGLFFAFVRKQENQGRDSLFLSGPDTGRIAFQSRDINVQTSKYFEQACWISLGSHAEDVGLVTRPFAASSQPIGFGNELAVQYDDAPQEVAILTNTGIHIIRRRRLVDIFASAVRNQGGEEALENEIKKFIRNYGRAETTATALAVACGQGSDITPGDPRLARVNNPETLELARKCFVEFGGRPSVDQNMVSEPSQAVDNVRPSSRHEGLAMYMGRLVRSIWKASVITQVVPKNTSTPTQINTTIPLAKLIAIQEDLTKLATFLEKNKSFIEGLAGPESLQRTASQQEAIALQGEHQALYSLQKLNSSIIEGISFVQMLFDERVDQIWSTLDDSVKQDFRNLTYEVLFSTDQGKDLAKILVKAIVNRNIANGSNVDTVAEALRRRCGSFCSADDVIIFRAQEQLKKASEVGANSDMGRKLLNESLKLFQQVAGALSFDNLQTAADQFTNLQFYAGAISLALLVAQESDRGNRALSWVNENRPADDARAPLYQFRQQCYKLIHTILLAVDTASNAEPEMIDGRLTLTATKRNEAHTVVNESEDELFQDGLYEWYLEQGWIEMLLSVDSPFVVRFLTKSASQSVDRADLLWKYHVHRNQFYEAAAVQLELAKKADFMISLAHRIEYLSRAKANSMAQSLGVGRQARHQLQYEVTELLEVAMIQDELLQRLKNDQRIVQDRRDEIVAELNGPIVDLSEVSCFPPYSCVPTNTKQLFNQYADQASYHDICLSIYEAANHRNPADINATWQALLDFTHSKVADAGANAGQQPYEAVITMVRAMHQRLGSSELCFSPQFLIPLFERYAIEHQNGVGPEFWLPDLFMEVDFAYETIVQVLQSMWYSNIAPFTGRRKQVLAAHLLYVLEQWFLDCERNNNRLFGSEENAQDISQLLEALAAGGEALRQQDVEKCAELRRRILRSFR